MELCGLAMILVGIGMAYPVGEEWWVRLIIAGMLVLLFFMAQAQERWKTRERHRLIESALKRTGATGGSGRSKGKTSRHPRPRRGGKPVEPGSSRTAQGEPARLGDGGMSPVLPHAPVRVPVGEAVKKPRGKPPREATRPGETDRRKGP
jgi:hypothetical protein